MKWIEKYSGWICLGFIALYLSPLFILGEDAYLCIWDGLEYMPMYHFIANSPYLFSNNHTIVPDLLGGIPRVGFPSELNVQVWLYYFFSPFAAYAINLLIVHLVAFYGARVLIKNHLLKLFDTSGINEEYIWMLVNGSALYFALLPHWPLGGISIAGMPLLFNSFLNIWHKKDSIYDKILIVVYPLYSSFLFANMFVFLFLILLGGGWCIWYKKWHRKFFVYLLLFLIVNILVEYRLFLSVFQGFESHRYVYAGNHTFMPVKEIVKKILYLHDLFFLSYMDAPVKVFPIVFSACLFTIILAYLNGAFRIRNYMAVLLLVLFVIAYLNYFKMMVLNIVPVPANLKNILSGVTLRAYILSPALWLIAFAFSILYVATSFAHQRGKRLTLTVLSLNSIFLLLTTGTTYSYNITGGLESPLSNNIKKLHPTYREYLDTELFNRIKTYIMDNYHLNAHAYKTLTLVNDLSYPSFSSMIPFFNGFYVADGYCVYYPKATHEWFSHLIYHQYPVSNKAYVYSSDTTDKGDIRYLNINYELAKEKNIRFLFSLKKILQPTEHVHLVNTFKGLYWNIYLYELK